MANRQNRIDFAQQFASPTTGIIATHSASNRCWRAGTSLGWVQDSINISDYAGQQILLRCEYITDDAVFSRGACFDDFEIPELDWIDDTSTSGDWTANVFALVEEMIPTQYLVQVIHEKAVGEPVVYQIPIGADAKGGMTVEEVGDDDLIVVVISAVNRQSTIATEYTLDIKPKF